MREKFYLSYKLDATPIKSCEKKGGVLKKERHSKSPPVKAFETGIPFIESTS